MGYDALDLAIRTLFLALVPVFVATTGAGLLMSIIQTATAISEPALGYAVRLLAFSVSLYFVLPGTVELLLELMQMVLS